MDVSCGITCDVDVDVDVDVCISISNIHMTATSRSVMGVTRNVTLHM